MEMKLTMDLCSKLANLRKEKGMSQSELALKLNVSRQAISRWEVGSSVPNTDNLILLSELYCVPLEYLLVDGNEDYGHHADQPQEMEQGQERKIPPLKSGNANGRRWLVAGIAVGVIVFVIFTTLLLNAFSNMSSESPQIDPIEDLNSSKKDDYPTFTFSFD